MAVTGRKEKEGKNMNLLYKSTRNAEKTVTASEAILKGLAEDGGLFVPGIGTETGRVDAGTEIYDISGNSLRGYEAVPY